MVKSEWKFKFPKEHETASQGDWWSISPGRLARAEHSGAFSEWRWADSPSTCGHSSLKPDPTPSYIETTQH